MFKRTRVYLLPLKTVIAYVQKIWMYNKLGLKWTQTCMIMAWSAKSNCVINYHEFKPLSNHLLLCRNLHRRCTYIWYIYDTYHYYIICVYVGMYITGHIVWQIASITLIILNNII